MFVSPSSSYKWRTDISLYALAMLIRQSISHFKKDSQKNDNSEELAAKVSSSTDCFKAKIS